MKLFKVTYPDLTEIYWPDYETAELAYIAAVSELKDADSDQAVVELTRVDVTVDKVTVLNLLNGNGGYENSYKVLKRATPSEEE